VDYSGRLDPTFHPLRSVCHPPAIVVTCADKATPGEIVREANGGIVSPAEDPAALAEVLRQVKRGEIQMDAYRANARQYAIERFDRHAVYGPIAAELHDRFDNGQPGGAPLPATFISRNTGET